MRHKLWSLSLVCGLIFLISLAEARTLIVAVDDLSVRAGPGRTYDIVEKINKNERFEILEEKEGWYKINVEGVLGWVSDKAVRVVEESRRGPAQETGGELSSRSTISQLYRRSWAIVIGINDYDKWPPLEYAVNDAQSVKNKLREFGFDEIISLENKQATRANIMRILWDELPQKVQEGDRVLIFYAGHGQTEELGDGSQMGYIVPVDADQYTSSQISMLEIREISQRLWRARHIYYVMDSCYSGLGLTKAGSGLLPPSWDYLEKITSKRAVQMITAGGKGEQVVEERGHGLFTRYFLKGLEGEADTSPRDGIVTAGELGVYLRPTVSMASNNKQTPLYGTLEGEGEMVFILPENEQLIAVEPEPTPGVEDSQNQKIQELLKQADAYFERKWYTTPEETNAFDLYQEVLKLDPTHKHAEEQIKQIAEFYRSQAEQMVQAEKIQRAIEYYRKYLKVLPTDETIRNKIAELEQQQAEAVQKQKEEEALRKQREQEEALKRQQEEEKRKQVEAVKLQEETLKKQKEKVEILKQKEGKTRKVEKSPNHQKSESPAGYIPSFEAKVNALKFFESGPQPPPVGQRVYGHRFASSNRFISWELSLEHPARDQDMDLMIEAIWSREDGSVFRQKTLPVRLKAYSTSSVSWYGFDNWPTGSYRVDLYVKGRKIASSSFEIY